MILTSVTAAALLCTVPATPTSGRLAAAGEILVNTWGAVSEYSTTGVLIDVFEVSGATDLAGVAQLPSGYWVTTRREPDDGLLVYDPYTGTVVLDVDLPELSLAGDVGARPDGTVVVVDQGNKRVNQYDLTGKWLNEPGWPTSMSGAPVGIYVEPKGDMWVTTQAAPEIAHLDVNGNVVAVLSVAGTTGDIVVAPDDTLWVSGKDSGFVYHYDQAGNLLGSFDTKLSGSFYGLALAEDGTLWCSTRLSPITNFDQAGNVLGSFSAGFPAFLWYEHSDDGPGHVYCTPEDGSPNNTTFIGATGTSLSGPIEVVASAGQPGQFGYLLIGDNNGIVSQPPGSKGDLCVAGGSCMGRYAQDAAAFDAGGRIVTDISNSSSGGPGFGIPQCGGTLGVGETWYFQYWHRQPMGQPATFSAAMRVTVTN